MVAGTGGVAQALPQVASSYAQLLSVHKGQFVCMKALEKAVPPVDLGQVAAWFGSVNKFAHTDLLVISFPHAVPVEVGGAGDVTAGLRYGNHSLIGQYEDNIGSKIAKDVRLGRTFDFPQGRGESDIWSARATSGSGNFHIEIHNYL